MLTTLEQITYISDSKWLKLSLWYFLLPRHPAPHTHTKSFSLQMQWYLHLCKLGTGVHHYDIFLTLLSIQTIAGFCLYHLIFLEGRCFSSFPLTICLSTIKFFWIIATYDTLASKLEQSNLFYHIASKWIFEKQSIYSVSHF